MRNTCQELIGMGIWGFVEKTWKYHQCGRACQGKHVRLSLSNVCVCDIHTSQQAAAGHKPTMGPAREHLAVL